MLLLILCRGLPLDERQSAAELEAVLQHHHNLQEKLAEDMLNLARNLKNNTLAAQNIIKQDNQVFFKPPVFTTSGLLKTFLFYFLIRFFFWPIFLHISGRLVFSLFLFPTCSS